MNLWVGEKVPNLRDAINKSAHMCWVFAVFSPLLLTLHLMAFEWNLCGSRIICALWFDIWWCHWVQISEKSFEVLWKLSAPDFLSTSVKSNPKSSAHSAELFRTRRIQKFSQFCFSPSVQFQFQRATFIEIHSQIPEQFCCFFVYLHFQCQCPAPHVPHISKVFRLNVYREKNSFINRSFRAEKFCHIASDKKTSRD